MKVAKAFARDLDYWNKDHPKLFDPVEGLASKIAPIEYVNLP